MSGKNHPYRGNKLYGPTVDLWEAEQDYTPPDAKKLFSDSPHLVRPVPVGLNPKQRWGLIGFGLRTLIQSRKNLTIHSNGYIDRTLNKQHLQAFALAYRIIWDNVGAAQADTNPYMGAEHLFSSKFESLSEQRVAKLDPSAAEIANTVKLMGNQLGGPSSDILLLDSNTNTQMVDWLEGQYKALHRVLPFPPVSIHNVITQNSTGIQPTQLAGLRKALKVTSMKHATIDTPEME